MNDERVQLSIEWSLVVILVAVVAGYARRISGEADRQHSLALDRLGRLTDANALLFSLHRVTQTLPASLDLDDVLDTTITRLRGLFEFDSAAIMVLDDTDAGWQVVRRENVRLPAQLSRAELPPPLRSALATNSVLSVPDLATEGGPGLSPKASSGLYAVLAARGAVIGLLAVEHQSARAFTSRDVELLRGFVEPVALAIDNARWFGRLRTVGADEERTRIARDLHDRIGQSLAYLAFELDRIVANQGKGDDVGPSLEHLRDDVRSVIREVRDTLYDLRTDVSDRQDMAATLESHIARVRERSHLEIELFCDRGARLPILQEREMWRIAQEALTNVERHANATRARVLWRCNGVSAALEVTDNGQGFPIGTAGRLDSYGILGMRERASSIGATLELSSQVGPGHPGPGQPDPRRRVRRGPAHGVRTVAGVSAWPAAGTSWAVRSDDRFPTWASRTSRLRTRPGFDAPGVTSLEGARVSIRLMLADDHRMLREGLRRSMIDQGFDVVGEARDGEEAIRLAHELHPEVILMDVTMPEVDGVEATRQIRSELPDIKVVMLTMHADQEVLTSAIRAGANGYLVKDCSTDEIASAVRMAVSGETALSPQLAASMLDEVRRLDRPSSEEDRIVTRREEEVLQLIADGCSTPEVAEKLYISQKTVKNHLASIYQKLDARDRTQAVLQAVRMGIVSLD